jgi:hypothetical protein
MCVGADEFWVGVEDGGEMVRVVASEVAGLLIKLATFLTLGD